MVLMEDIGGYFVKRWMLVFVIIALCIFDPIVGFYPPKISRPLRPDILGTLSDVSQARTDTRPFGFYGDV